MTEENEKTISPRAKRPIYLSPWLVALAALALYACTLNPWVTFRSLPLASQIMGWNWHPGPLAWQINPQYQPLYLVFTFPLHWLPADWRITGLNVLTAVCAALTLAILARSVKLLAHNRTKEQRVRLGEKSALLSVRAAFLPAAFAVALLAGQLTFWENAVSGTGEMIDLLVFAFLILCLLEFRHTRAEGWLSLFTFTYGLGVSNNWGLIGFFPCFLGALIWIKGLAFFKWKFALRLAAWGALGLLLYTLVPILGVAHHDGGFWEILHEKLAEQRIYLTRTQRYFAAIAAVPSLIPLIFAGIYWPSSEGELNPGARDLTRGLFRVLHIVFLAVGVLMFFDIAISASPRRMGLGVGQGVPSFLSFYYLAAVSVGYYSGYVLLVFGKDVEFRWGQATGLLHLTNMALTTLFWVAAVVLPALLFYRNFSHIQDYNSPVVAQFGREMAGSLPAKPAIVLADDQARLYLAMGAARRLSLPDQYIFIESRELIHREYLRYLADRYPAFRKELKPPDSLPEEITTRQAADLLADLAKHGSVFYLHPSFGGYFEQIYMLPHRLGGYVCPYPTNGTGVLVLDQSGVVTNQAYWHALERGPLASLPEFAKTGPDGLPERSADAVRIAGYYSQMVDCWGVELQEAASDTNFTRPAREAMLKDADDQFTWAIRLNNNIIARLNREYNEKSLRGVPLSGPPVTQAEMATEMSSWDRMFNLDGPVDVFSLNLQVGRFFAEYGMYRQAARMFQRCLELVPNNSLAELDLAKTYIDMGALDSAANVLHLIPETAPLDPLERARVEALAYEKKNDFERADKVLTEAHNKNPRNGAFADTMADFYRLMGYSALLESKDPAAGEKAAARWFRKSANALEEELSLRSAPADVAAHESEIPRINLQRVEMQMMLKDYSNAILTSTSMLRQTPGINPLERVRVESLAYARKSDFETIDQLLTDGRARNPKDAEFAGVAAGLYRLMGYSVMRESNGDAAKEKGSAQWFKKSLAALDGELKLLSDPVKATAHAAEIPPINLQRAEMQMMLKDYPAAIATCATMLHQYPGNPLLLLNRAISELQLGQLDAAKSDYQAVDKTAGTSPVVYFGLAQIAQKQNDKKAEIHYDQLYVRYAPTNTAEFTNVTRQLRKLEGR